MLFRLIDRMALFTLSHLLLYVRGETAENRILCKGYWPGTRGYVIYSPRGVPEGNISHISHIPEGQVNNILIVWVGEDS